MFRATLGQLCALHVLPVVCLSATKYFIIVIGWRKNFVIFSEPRFMLESKIYFMATFFPLPAETQTKQSTRKTVSSRRWISLKTWNQPSCCFEFSLCVMKSEILFLSKQLNINFLHTQTLKCLCDGRKMERRKTRLEYLKFQRAEKLQNNAMQTIMDVVEFEEVC